MDPFDLSTHAPAWLGGSDEHGVVISTRVRLARNLAGLPFPAQASEHQRRAVRAQIDNGITRCGLELPCRYDLASISPQALLILMERGLASTAQTAHACGTASACSADESLSILYNEEDHLRIQLRLPGAALEEALSRAIACERRLGAELEFAFDHSLGYLSACPSNLGTGLRASVLLRLVATELSDGLGHLRNAAAAAGLVLRGPDGEDSQLACYHWQLSNQVTLGHDEESLTARVAKFASLATAAELEARSRLLRERPAVLANAFSRAWWWTQASATLTENEAREVCHIIAAGAALGMLSRPDSAHAMALSVLCRDAHLRHQLQCELHHDVLDAARATFLASSLRK